MTVVTTPSLTPEQSAALHRAEAYLTGHPDIEIRERYREGVMSLEVRYVGTTAEPEEAAWARIRAVMDMAEAWGWPLAAHWPDGEFGVRHDGVFLWGWAR